MHEASQHDHNSFITLTYSDEHLPAGGSLHKPDFQKFMKRLREQTQQKIRYYMCGEYGDKLGRPHYHALIFGYDFSDKTLWEIRKENKFYRSKQLEKLWRLGYSSISEVTFSSAAYVARYVMKKINGQKAHDHYQKLDKETGELIPVHPEYNSMSLKPGIASNWYEKFTSDVYPADNIILSGKKYRTPRYYDRKLKAAYPGAHEILKTRRKKQALKHLANNTPERLKVRENIAIAKNKLNPRTLK